MPCRKHWRRTWLSPRSGHDGLVDIGADRISDGHYPRGQPLQDVASWCIRRASLAVHSDSTESLYQRELRPAAGPFGSYVFDTSCSAWWTIRTGSNHADGDISAVCRRRCLFALHVSSARRSTQVAETGLRTGEEIAASKSRKRFPARPPKGRNLDIRLRCNDRMRIGQERRDHRH